MNRRLLEAEKETVFWTNRRLQLTIPSVLARGEEFSLRMTAFGPEGLPSEGFDRAIRFEESRGIEGLPEAVGFSKGDGGHLALEGLRAVGPDEALVCARPEGCPQEVRSNPAWVFEDPPYRLYWGDLHVHTTYSNCSAWACMDPEVCYAYARDDTHLDFAAAADHLRGIASAECRWPRLQELVRQYDSAGSFVPLLAFESSHKTGFGGDINAYFLGSDAPYFWLDREDMRGTVPEVTLRELWGFLDATGKEYLTIPHHTGRAGKHRSYADPAYDAEREPLFEVYSMWGSSESRVSRFPLSGGNSDAPAYFQDALKAGCRYGVIASSDDHRTMPGGESKPCLPAGPMRLANYVHHGLAAVRAPELSREGLWKGLVSRSCYGTTFARTLLDFSIGDLAMGQEARIGPDDPLRRRREIRVRALASGPEPVTAVLVRNGEEMARARPKPGQPCLVFEDTDALDAIAVRDARFHAEPFAVYYVRLETRSHQTQWSSPIWLDL